MINYDIRSPDMIIQKMYEQILESDKTSEDSKREALEYLLKCPNYVNRLQRKDHKSIMGDQ